MLFCRNPEELRPFLEKMMRNPELMESIKNDPIYQKLMTTTTNQTPKQEDTSKPKEEKVGEKKCWVCGKPNSMKCSKCKAAAYCSVECQRTDWPSHKTKCIKKT